MKDKKILLTGGNGFWGRFVKKELLDKGVEEKNIFIPDLPDFDLRDPKTERKAVSAYQKIEKKAGEKINK